MKRFWLIVWFLVMNSVPGNTQGIFKIDSFETHFSDWQVKTFKGRAD